MDLVSAYEAEYRLIETWLDQVFPRALADAGLPVAPSAPPPDVNDVARDERWFAVRAADAMAALLQVYLNTNRCNVVIVLAPDAPHAVFAERIATTTVGAKRLGWTFHTVDERRVVCFFDGLDLAASTGVNSGWIARDTARMLRWLLSTGTTF
ncbi:hypothetical protein SAMN02745157_5030 [Kaistia soli DSM 19436]|uniref:Uncharacterized protein n=1 Tax=Kaistia soli DSM 19436 TaxID=1122133 RepID=A0A1M5NMF7_9HYPH|nr:hypothetical protein [Kaistia soli]SHG90123.1 hypothetical protein SAMN02745157_5030 [Kaistia soli DSM 19436]